MWLRSWIALFFWWALLVMTLDWVMYMAGAMILSVDVSLTRAFIVYMCGLVSAWWLAHLTWYATLRRRGCACAFCCCCVDAPVLMLIHAVALAMWGVLLTVNAFVVLTYSGPRRRPEFGRTTPRSPRPAHAPDSSHGGGV